MLALDAEHLWHPWSPTRVNPDTVLAVSGEGCRVTDADGRDFLDAKSSGFNATLGYGRTEIVEAVTDQLSRLMTYDLGEGSTLPAVALARRMADLTGPPLTRTYFCNSGSEGVEAAVRISRFYHAVRGFPGRFGIVSLHGGYHGSTMGASACAPAPTPISSLVTAPGFTVLSGPERPDHRSLLAEVERHLTEHGDQTAAVIVEPVQARFARVLPDTFLRELRDLCDRRGVLLIFDEVTTGFGRTGRMFAWQHGGTRPDILITGKGLTAGYMSLSAVTTTGEVFDAFDRNKSQAGFVHGHTHSGHAAACAAGLAVIDILETEDLAGNARDRGRQLLTGLEPARSLSSVRETRGLGLLVAVELDSSARASGVRRRMKDDGVLVRRVGPAIILAPPLTVRSVEIEEITVKLLAALETENAA
ncbi:aspartate aminotransferase family protein [Nocardiopsis alba]|uniref:aminotransferase family protein n=1 Tax=Nocardiopsis alba TaxID=53437 RepID=UPI00366DB5F4